MNTPATFNQTLTVTQRRRCQAANRLGAALTEAARDGRHHDHIATVRRVPLRELPAGTDIIAQAKTFAADPLAGALRIGRTRHGDPVAIVLHARKWSLVLRPHRSRPGVPTTADAFTFLDGYGNPASTTTPVRWVRPGPRWSPKSWP
jgi:hypothetical protein